MKFYKELMDMTQREDKKLQDIEVTS